MDEGSLKPSQILSIVVTAIGILVLVGWTLQNGPLTRVFPDFIAMKANTALCFVLFGISSLFAISSQPNLRLVSFLFALAGGLIAFLTLGEILLGWNLGIDELLFVDVLDPIGTAAPGRMAPLTAVCFSLLGLVSVLGPRLSTRSKQIVLLSVLAIAISGFVSYPFSLVSGTGLYSASGMALHTAFLFILLALVYFLNQSDPGWITVLLSRSPLGDNTRSLLITVILTPFVLGWLAYAAESAGWVNSGVARLYFSISVMLLLTIVVLYNAQRLFDAEKMRQVLTSDYQSLQKQLQGLVDNSPAAISIKDRNGRYLLINNHFERLVKRSRSQILGKKAEAIFESPVLVDVLESSRQVVDKEDVVTTEITLDFEGSPHTYMNTEFPLLDSQGQVDSIGGIWTDISEHKLLTETLNAKNIDLERSNKELEQFAYVASHDLQEPLRMVSSYMQLLETRYKSKLDQDAQEFIDFAVDGALRMQSLIQDLLAFSRVGTRGKDPSPVDASFALADAMQNLKMRMEETAAKVEADPLPTVLADKDQLVQVFQNLIGNALKFKGENEPEIRISVQESQGFAQFCVADNGIGFDSKHADRIFVLFQRLNTRDKYEGTGIGLAICKKIVERHGGHIWAESQLGKGSSFFFTFPLVPVLLDEPGKGAENTKEEAESFEERASRLI